MAPIINWDLYDKDPLKTTQKTVCYTLITHLIKQQNITGGRLQRGDKITKALIESLHSITWKNLQSLMQPVVLTDIKVAWCEIISNSRLFGCFPVAFHSFYFLIPWVSGWLWIWHILKQTTVRFKVKVWHAFWKQKQYQQEIWHKDTFKGLLRYKTILLDTLSKWLFLPSTFSPLTTYRFHNFK